MGKPDVINTFLMQSKDQDRCYAPEHLRDASLAAYLQIAPGSRQVPAYFVLLTKPNLT